MTTADHVRYGNTIIDFTVRRSARRKKTMQITAAGEGVHVDAPLETTDDDVRAFVLRKAPWVLGKGRAGVIMVHAEALCQRRNIALPRTQRCPGGGAARHPQDIGAIRPLAASGRCA